MNKVYSIFKYLIGWPLSFISLIFIFRIIFTNANKSFLELKEINFYFLFLSIVCFTIYFFLRAVLWKYILGEKGKQFNFKKIMLNWSTSELKRYVPGSIWSFISRTTSFETTNLSKKEILVFLAHEAIILCLASFTLSYFYLSTISNSQILKNFVLIFIILSIFIYVFGIKVIKKFSLLKVIERLCYLFLPSFSPFDNLKLLLLGILTFFLLGLGTYFSLVSIFYIDLKHILTLVSLFTFSFFIGYISLITPMGLGVREGITTYGLLPFLASGSAALVALFSRVIFIISELISLLIVILWNKLNFKLLKQIEEFIVKYKYEFLLIIFISIYIIYFTTASFLRYDNFYTGRFDLGNMDQTVWNTIHGRIFQLTDPNGTQTISRLSVHADFILVLISPLYLIWSNPKMLLMLQTFVLAFGAFFIYLISKEVLKNKFASLTFGLTFLLSPAIGYINLYDFHPVALASTFLLITFYFYLKKKYLWFLVFAILSALTKEELWAIVGIFGFFILIRSIKENEVKNNFEKMLGTFLFIFGFGFSYLLIAKIIPLVKGSDHFALSYYADFGSSPLEIVRTIILNPVKTFSTFFEYNRITYISQLIGPLGFLSILAPAFLIFAAPDLLISLLSNNHQLHQIYYQYSASIIPFVFISAIYGSKLIVDRIKFIDYQKISIYILITSLFYLYITGPLAGSKNANIDMFSKQLTNSKNISRFLSSIPKEYSIAATNNLGSHLSRRQDIYNIPLGLDRADVIVFLIDHGFSDQNIAKQIIMINKIKKNSDYVLILQDKDFFAFKKSDLPL